MKEIILASASPRRLDLLRQIGLDPIVKVVEYEENMAQDYLPETLVCENASGKAEAAARSMVNHQAIIIAADTVVTLDQVTLGKPSDQKDAQSMLRALSGRQHEVITGVCLWDCASGMNLTRAIKTIVTMRKISEAEILAYSEISEPYDKAGGYGIQQRAGLFVEKIEGSYSNVVGLPLGAVGLMLHELGYEVTAQW